MMAQFLIFSLTATLGAMGELAGHERRGTLVWPGRSAILGLLGAAKGIDRTGDFSALDALDIAVAVFDSGGLLRDYHTVQTVPSAAVNKPNSRPEALAAAKHRTNTTITKRDYRTGSLYGVAVWGNEQTLTQLLDALNEPMYTLYLGRKSCPLAAPPGAKIVVAEAPAAALTHLVLPPWRRFDRNGDAVTAKTLIVEHHDGTAGAIGETVNDVPIDRKLWHYTSRRVNQQPVEIIVRGPA